MFHQKYTKQTARYNFFPRCAPAKTLKGERLFQAIISLTIVLSFIWLDRQNCVTGTEIGGAWFSENSLNRLPACFVHPVSQRTIVWESQRRVENKSGRLAVTSMFAALTSFSCEKAGENKKRNEDLCREGKKRGSYAAAQVQGHGRPFRNLRHSWRICGIRWRRAHFLFSFLIARDDWKNCTNRTSFDVVRCSFFFFFLFPCFCRHLRYVISWFVSLKWRRAELKKYAWHFTIYRNDHRPGIR